MRTRRWYYVQFDPNWVVCRNWKCRAQFIRANIAAKRKCPKCKLNNYGCLPRKKEAHHDADHA
jgi:hypothetical protein